MFLGEICAESIAITRVFMMTNCTGAKDITVKWAVRRAVIRAMYRARSGAMSRAVWGSMGKTIVRSLVVRFMMITRAYHMRRVIVIDIKIIGKEEITFVIGRCVRRSKYWEMRWAVGWAMAGWMRWAMRWAMRWTMERAMRWSMIVIQSKRIIVYRFLQATSMCRVTWEPTEETSTFKAAVHLSDGMASALLLKAYHIIRDTTDELIRGGIAESIFPDEEVSSGIWAVRHTRTATTPVFTRDYVMISSWKNNTQTKLTVIYLIKLKQDLCYSDHNISTYTDRDIY